MKKRKKLELLPKPWYPSLIADEIELVYPLKTKKRGLFRMLYRKRRRS